MKIYPIHDNPSAPNTLVIEKKMATSSIRLDDVFGVTSKPVRSYVEREDIDTRFREALTSGKQIVVYDSSKQGKTALVSKHLPYDDNLLVSLTPKTQLIDVYNRILTDAGVRLTAGTTEKRSSETSASVSAKFEAMIPIFGERKLRLRASLRGPLERKSDMKKYQ